MSKALAKAQREAKEAKEAAEQARLECNATNAAIQASIGVEHIPTVVKGVTDAYADARATNTPFNYVHALSTAISKVRTTAMTPPSPRGTPGGLSARTAMTPQQIQEDRERYRARLRQLGILDPAVHSVPGDVGQGSFGFGPSGSK
ncbi:MAG: hypothetical protein IPG50_09505 [Myxococcales bacterium]|nr:hypothetical protein [Myxococcales bacterium]